MRLDFKDSVGAAIVLGTLGLLALHNSRFGHPGGHQMAIADARGSVTSPVGEPATAFVDFNVVPMDRDAVLRHQVVVVRGGVIESIGDMDGTAPPRDATVIEGDGVHFLAPGLTDAHVHLRDRFESWLPLFIANGVTTVFNMEGRPIHLELRRRIWEGEVEGPTIYTAGPFVEEPAVRTPADARRTVARQAALGYDFVKVHGNLSAETYRTLTEAGRELNIPVIGHAPRNLPFSAVLENRQVAVTHAEEIIQTELKTLDPEGAVDVARRMAAAGTWIMPTLAHFRSTADQWGAPAAVEAALASEEASWLPRSLRSQWRAANVYLGVDAADRDRLQAMYEYHRPLIQALYAAGVPMLAGTDTPIPTMAPGSSLHREVEALEDVGLSGYDALATATTNPGRFVREYVRAGVHFGTIEPGARADILVLEADPRVATSTLRRPQGVMVRGRWYDRSDLDRLLRQAADGR